MRSCWNPAHLRLVTNAVNLTENVVGSAWQLNAAKTHCKHGHEFTPENTMGRGQRAGRQCRTCHNINRATRRLRAA